MTSLAVLLIGSAWGFQRRFIYLPVQQVPPISSKLPGGEVVRYATADGVSIRSWLIAPEGRIEGAIIVFHGVGGNRSSLAPLARTFTADGYLVLLADYRGYGGNEGSPTESGLLQDAIAARRFLESRSDVEALPIVYLGESLGAAVAVDLAEVMPPAALVLLSPFTSMADAARVRLGVITDWFVRDKYLVKDEIRTIDVPLLVIAGAADQIIPESMSREVFDAAADPRSFVSLQGADHTVSVTHEREVTRASIDFLKDALESGPQR